MGSNILSIQGIIYFSSTTRASWGTATSGIYSAAAPTGLTKIGGVIDVTAEMDKDEVDASTRDAPGWEQIVGSLRKGPLTVKCLHNFADAGQLKLWQSYAQNGPPAMAPICMLDGDKATTGSMGFWIDMEVLKASKGEPLRGIQTTDFMMKPSAFSAVPPQIVTVGS